MRFLAIFSALDRSDRQNPKTLCIATPFDISEERTEQGLERVRKEYAYLGKFGPAGITDPAELLEGPRRDEILFSRIFFDGTYPELPREGAACTPIIKAIMLNDESLPVNRWFGLSNKDLNASLKKHFTQHSIEGFQAYLSKFLTSKNDLSHIDFLEKVASGHVGMRIDENKRLKVNHIDFEAIGEINIGAFDILESHFLAYMADVDALKRIVRSRPEVVGDEIREIFASGCAED